VATDGGDGSDTYVVDGATITVSLIVDGATITVSGGLESPAAATAKKVGFFALFAETYCRDSAGQ
jgi:hypothetical protein